MGGILSAIDTRLVTRAAKLAGAPRDPAAGATVSHDRCAGSEGLQSRDPEVPQAILGEFMRRSAA
jgi:hypothetical protein